MKIRLFFVFFVIQTALFALPGIHDALPDASGEFVYFRDYTFFSETYIGFLQYDDETIAVRYIAHEPEKGSREVVTAIKLNPESDFIDITGEKFLSEVTQDDIEIVNYLHDMLYEFAGRRKKLNGKKFSDRLSVTEEFFQFGGMATLFYEQFVPIFNLRKITGEDESVLLEAITFGQLKDSADKSFFDFLPDVAAEKKLKAQSIADAAKITVNEKSKQAVRFDSLTAVLDDNWQPVAENFWMLGDHALLLFDAFQMNDAAFTGGKFSVFDYFKRNFLLSSEGKFNLLPETKLQQSETSLLVESLSIEQEQESSRLAREVKILTKKTGDTYFFATFAVYENAYRANKEYFDALITSITVSNE